MTQFLLTLLNMSLTAAFVAVVVFLLRLVLKGRVARQMVCLLWLLVFARLLIPVTLQSPVSLVPDMEMGDPAPVVSAAPEAVPTLPVNTSPIQGGTTEAPPVVSYPIQTPVATSPVVTVPPVTSDPEPVVSAPVAETPPAEELPFPWAAVLTVVWAVGVAAMLVYGMGSYLSIRRKLRFAIRTKEGWWEDPHLCSPFILGLVRPKIYLPCHMTPYTRQFILCHERAHIRRGDHIIKPICWLALAIHWFNPLAWVAFLLLSRDIEVACDESVLRQLGSEVKADYSATLLALATNGRFPAPTPLAFGEGDAKTRIKSVLSFKKPALWVTIAAVVVAIVAAVCLLTDPVDKFDPDDYITYDYYPGLYFEETTDERTGETIAKAYRLENNKPVLVAGLVCHTGYYSDLIHDPQPYNYYALIHPDGTEDEPDSENSLSALSAYEQYLADAMRRLDQNWPGTYLRQTSVFRDGENAAVMALYYTPNGNLLLSQDGECHVVPLEAHLTRDSLYYAHLHDVDEDNEDELLLVWDDVLTGFSADHPEAPFYTGDILMVCEWDGETWIPYNSHSAVLSPRKPITLVYRDGSVSAVYDILAPGEEGYVCSLNPGVQTLVPEELGVGEALGVTGPAQIQITGASDYKLSYTVYGIPDAGNYTDIEPVLYLNAQMTYNGETHKFDITFTGAEKPGKADDGEGGQTYTAIPDDAEPLYDSGVASFYGLPDGTVILQYGNYIQALEDFGYNALRPGCTAWETDGDGDGVKELHIIHQYGSGTGVSIDKLTTCVPDGDRLNVTCHDWSSLEPLFEQNNRFTYYPEDNSISVTYGGQNLRLRLGNLYQSLDWDSYGDSLIIATVANYALNEDGTVTLSFAPALSDGSPMVNYLPMRVNYTLVLKKDLTGRLCWNGGDPLLTANDPGMVVQPYTVTPLEDSLEDVWYTRFELTHNGKTVRFSGHHLKNALAEEGDDMLTYYFDMTGDGVPDPVVMLVRVYGSGPVKRDIHVFDGVTLEEYDMSGLLSVAEAAFTFTGDEDNFFITGENLSVTIPKADVFSFYGEHILYPEFTALPDSMELIEDSLLVTEKDGMLCVNLVCLVFQHRVMGHLSYGSVNAYMTLVDGKLTPVKLTFTDVEGREITDNRFSSLLGSLNLPNEIVTNETLPTDPEQYYLVAELNGYALYTRNYGWGGILLTYGNVFQRYDHTAHTPHMNLPILKELDSETLAVISEVNTGTGVGVDELVVYRSAQHLLDNGSYSLGWDDYLYDWRDLAADFNRNNTLTYDKLSNSFTLVWNGNTYSSGRMAEDQSVYLGLEDGFTGALIATGEIIRFTMNQDGTFTARMETSVGRGNKGGFYNSGEEWFWWAEDQDNHYSPLSIGTTGFELVWTVRFTGEGFEVVSGPAIASKASSHPAPDFLTEDQQILYHQAMAAYASLFGASPAEGLVSEGNQQQVTVNGVNYFIVDRYSDWAEFDGAVRALFTDQFWQERNGIRFAEYNGKAAVIDAARGGGYYYNSNFADEFKLISATDNEITFSLIGHYTQVWPIEGMTAEERDEYRRTTCEYTYEFPIRMVETEDGWRFDEFYSASIDEKAPEDPGIVVVNERPAVWITAEDLFLAALNDELEFTQYSPYHAEPKTGTLSDFLAVGDPPLSIISMTLVDMDGDGTRELLLDLCIIDFPFGTVILRYDPAASALTGHMFWIRNMESIAADGTFQHSGSTEDSGIARLSFTEQGSVKEKLCYREVSGDTIRYYVDGVRSTEAAYDQAIESQRQLAEALVWLEYTPDNVKQLLVPG